MCPLVELEYHEQTLHITNTDNRDKITRYSTQEKKEKENCVPVKLLPVSTRILLGRSKTFADGDSKGTSASV
jgi:hypothetical protein